MVACAIAQVAGSYWPMYLSISLGAYTAMTSSELDRTAKLDTLFFVVLMAIVVFSYWGALYLLPVFCVAGLPAIDDGLIVLSKWGIIERELEKKVKAAITLWVRIPGLIAAATIAWVCLMHGTATRRLPLPVVLITIAGCVANAGFSGARGAREGYVELGTANSK